LDSATFFSSREAKISDEISPLGFACFGVGEWQSKPTHNPVPILDRAGHQKELQQAIIALRNGSTTSMAGWLRQHLFEHILPFWDPQVDEIHGGLFTCVTDGGEKVAGDKWLWSQWRAVWVFSRIFNTLDPDPKWRDRAEQIARFCCRHGWLEAEQGWALLLEERGQIKRAYESIYVDAFAVYGLSELYRATGNREWIERAQHTATAAIRRIESTGDQLPHFPYDIVPGTKPHGVPMIWSLKLAALGAASQDHRWTERAWAMLREIDADFYDPATDRVCETASLDGDNATLRPRVTLPGHVIEGMWFRLVAEQTADQPTLPPTEFWRRTARHVDLGWEESTGGGLLLATNAEGDVAETGWPFPDLKLWWPLTEALVASLFGWHQTRDETWHDWYARFWRTACDHYVDWQHGEWRQKLDRNLQPFSGTVALPVKDPFHLPRSLILQIELLESDHIPRP